ncbi:CoA transferase [Geobacillus sp. TFV-3]|uniref:CoA transferase n=1 Tax=Geobacillus sp. TFV-3 TaxID=1897059 RepID=UPI00135AED61|nr:CoA transferase [Geobacillus sp. TFV-3]KAF0995571.1 Acetyl-CoA:oxalate CoA-transferase [Geobacillus sp. TFV-3]
MLHGIVVVDFSHYLPGPFASWRLAQLGAEVIKIEPPSGDRLRPFAGGRMFAAYNAGKQSIALDLKKKAGREQARRLAALFREKTLDEWSAFAKAIDACLAPVLETGEAKALFADSRLRHLVRLQPNGAWTAAHGPDGQWGGVAAPDINEHAYLLGEGE